MQVKPRIFANNFAPADGKILYRPTEKQLELNGFQLPFSGKYSVDNRWVKLAQLIPWHRFEDEYCATLSKKGQGPPEFSICMALAALIIKERLRLPGEVLITICLSCSVNANGGTGICFGLLVYGFRWR